MVTDIQVRRLMKLIQTEATLAVAAAKAGMDEKTARKYRGTGRLPSEHRVEHTWRTRPDPFADVWHEIEEKLDDNAGFEAKTLFDDLQRRYPGRFQDGQLRTLQRRVKIWRALEGPANWPAAVLLRERLSPAALTRQYRRSHPRAGRSDPRCCRCGSTT